MHRPSKLLAAAFGLLATPALAVEKDGTAVVVAASHYVEPGETASFSVRFDGAAFDRDNSLNGGLFVDGSATVSASFGGQSFTCSGAYLLVKNDDTYAGDYVKLGGTSCEAAGLEVVDVEVYLVASDSTKQALGSGALVLPTDPVLGGAVLRAAGCFDAGCDPFSDGFVITAAPVILVPEAERGAAIVALLALGALARGRTHAAASGRSSPAPPRGRRFPGGRWRVPRRRSSAVIPS